MKKVYLVGRSGIHGNKEWLVENELILGRDASVCQLVYPNSERGVSSVHCKVQSINGMVQVTDMGSTNGTFLDTGVRLAPHTPQMLQSGQGFYLGDKMNSFAVRIQDDTAMEGSLSVEQRPTGGKVFSITSMVLGIVSVCLFFTYVVPIICGTVGVVFGAYALYTKKNGRGMAIAGLICSIIGIAIPLLMLLMLAIG